MTAAAKRGDAELVAGLRSGDQQCLAGIYDRYADRLYDFCTGMLRNRDDAADAVQDTFLVVSRRIEQLRDPERLRPWLYAIARSVVLDRIRARARSRPTEAVIDTPDPGAGPERQAEQEALRRLVADAADGLSDTDQVMLRLHLHGLQGAELGVAMGISARTAHVRLSRLRDQVEAALGALLVARLGRRECAGLAEVLGNWSGRLTPLLRKRVVRHVEGCPRCGERRRAAASPWALLSGLVVLPAPPELRTQVLGDVELVGVRATEATGPALADGATPAPSDWWSLPARTAAAVLLITVLAGGFLVALLRGTPPVTLAQAPALRPVTSAAGESLTAGTPTPGAPAVPAPGAGTGASVTGSSSTSAPNTTPGSGPDTAPSAPEPTLITGPPPTSEPPAPPPQITGQAASPARLGVRGCPVARAAVRVTTDAPATTVTLSWTGAGTSGSMPMRGSGTTWSGTLGPFPEPGGVVWSVTARNRAGSATGPAQTLGVTTCTGPTIGGR